MPEPDFEKMLKNLVDQLENYYFEYDALTVFLRKAGDDPPLLRNWEMALEVQRNDPLARAASHGLFDLLRVQLRECESAEAALQVLARLGDLMAEKQLP